MDCEVIVLNLSQYFNKELPSTINKRMEQHLQKCYTCQLLWQTFQKTILLFVSYGKNLQVKVSPEMHSRLISNLRLKLAEQRSDG